MGVSIITSTRYLTLRLLNVYIASCLRYLSISQASLERLLKVN